MLLALVRTKAGDRPRLALSAGNGRLIDVLAAHERRGQGGEAEAFQSVKALIEGGDRALDALRELREWSTGRLDEEAGNFLVNEKDVDFLPPVPDPEKFLCVGKNSKFHREELVRTGLIKEIPQEPTGFIKLNSVLVGHKAEVARPDGIGEFDYEP